jgi:hypothetical protein
VETVLIIRRAFVLIAYQSMGRIIQRWGRPKRLQRNTALVSNAAPDKATHISGFRAPVSFVESLAVPTKGMHPNSPDPEVLSTSSKFVD